MARYDFRTPRLFVEAPLAAQARIPLDRSRSHYLTTVLRLKADAPVLVFNGMDGEWLATLVPGPRKGAELVVAERTRAQTTPCDLHLCFAPLKHARFDYLVQKAVELGASRLQPVITRHTQSERVNVGRMRANAVEAAEQCGILDLADCRAPVALTRFLADRASGRLLVFCDEDADVGDPVAALRQAGDAQGCDVLIGPEGGFADEERTALRALPAAVRLSLGPRILRADTAAVAALTLVQAVRGDWR